MKIPTKQEYLKKLRLNRDYLAILKKTPEDQRKKIIGIVESIIEPLYDGIVLGINTANKNPEIAQQLSESLENDNNIIKESDGQPIKSKQEK